MTNKKIKEKRGVKHSKAHLKSIGCSIVEVEPRSESLNPDLTGYVPDLLGYRIDEEGNLNQEVVVEVTSEANPKAQNQLLRYAQKLEANKALLVVVISEEDEVKYEKYWFDAETGLPSDEPNLQSYSNYLVKEKDIADRIWEVMDYMRGEARNSYERVTILLKMLFLRRYLKTEDKLDEWNNLKLDQVKKLYEKAKQCYQIEGPELNINSNLITEDFVSLFNILPPASKKYIDIFISLIKRNNGISGLTEASTTKKLKDVLVKLIKPLGIDQGEVIDPAVGLGFILSDVAESTKADGYCGYEINGETTFYSKILSKISSEKEISIKCKDSLTLEEQNQYRLVLMQPPLGGVRGNIRDEYNKFEVVKEKRGKVRYSELFIEQGINLAEEEGFIVTVVPESILFTKESSFIREEILDRTIVRGILSLPNKILLSTSVRISVLILQKKSKKLSDGEEFFVGDITNMEKADEVINRFSKWIKKEV